MITALCLLRALKDASQTLTEATAGFQQYPQVLVNVRVREKLPFDELGSVDAAVRAVEERLGRQALHASVLGFRHPASGETLRFVSELPKDFGAALAALRALS